MIDGQAQAAIAALERATRADPASPVVWSNLGAAFYHDGRWVEAEAAYRQAIGLDAAFAEAISGLGAALKAQGRLAEAAALFVRAIRADPAHASAFNNLGNTLAALDRKTPALMAYRAALRRRPDYADALSNMGVLLRRLGRRREALAALERAVALAPASATAAFNLANALADDGDEDADGVVAAAYERVLTLRPQWASAHLNYGLWLLGRGRYEHGWAEYEWRWAMPAALPLARRFSQPRWTGQPLDGKVILISAEQGLGDTLQCARYFPLLAARGATVLVEAAPPLRDLLRTAPGVSRIVSAGDWIERIDFHCPVFSLPLAFATTLASIPANVPYLHAPRDLAARWADHLPPGPRIGLVWQGNAASRADRGRSFRLADLEPLAGATDAAFVSLQKGHGLDQLDGHAPFPIHRVGPEFDQGSLLDTAAIVANLDLVIACDTAVAHLAGALGRPVWLALKRRAEWRWLRERRDSPWYPTARLYRQATDGDWKGVFREMAEDLKDGRL
jgi:tetratricopeptide (TPR) repeat protein